MSDLMTFATRADFRAWLQQNCLASPGVWLLFGKPGGPQTLKANEALEEALCFGWIDGQMQSLGETTYKKYFSQRRAGSKWSAKNKDLVQKLVQQGIVAPPGLQKIEEAKQNGQWSAPKAPAVTDEHIAAVAALLAGHEPAFTNFQAMPPSVKKTYARAYFDAKTDTGRAGRLAWMTDRLAKNLKPM